MTPSNLDDILNLLSDHYRRQTVRVLRGTPESEVEFDELIDGIIQESRIEGQKADRIAVQLHHKHLPMLADQGLIAYDPDARIVRYSPDQQVEAVMDGIVENQSLVESQE